MSVTVPFMDLKAQVAPLRSEIDAAIKDVVDNTAFILGPRLEKFEKNFAEYCSTLHCAGVDSGTQALHLILRGLGIGAGDEVITVPNTFIATIEAIVYTGAKPVFVDVDPDTWLMDPTKLADAITDKTKAILPVHLFGHPVPFDEIKAVAGDIPIIEDACQAHGARYKGKRIGSLGFAGAFSFYPGKNLGDFGDGGAVVSNDMKLKEFIDSVRHHGQGAKNMHDSIGHTARLDSLQAVILDIKLHQLDNWSAMRRNNAALYKAKLQGSYRMPELVAETEAVHHLFPIQCDDPEGTISMLRENDVFCGRHYPVSCNLQPALKGIIDDKVSFPVSEELCSGIVSLPMFAELTEEMVDRVCELLL